MEKFSVRKPLTIFVAAIAVVLLGVVAFTRMTPDLLPNMDFPYVVIMTAVPGASPESVESQVTRPMEQAMATLEHIENVQSTSAESYSVVILEFEDGVNMDSIGVDIQQSIAALQGQWDDTVGTPYVLKINPSLLPVEVAAVAMEGMDSTELTDFAEDTLIPRLEGVTGVASVNAVGAVTRQVHVVIDEDMIAAVNERLAEAVNRQMDDAAAELDDALAELDDAQSELHSAQSELVSGRSALASQTAAAQAELNRRQTELLSGRMDILQQLNTLTAAQTELETTLSVLRPLAERLSSLEVREAELTARVAALEAEEAARQNEPEEPAEPETSGGDASGEASPDLADIIDAISDAAEDLAERSGGSELIAAQTELAVVQTELAAADAALEALGYDRAALPAAVAEMEAGLAQLEAGIDLLNDTLTQLDEGSSQLSDALAMLNQAQSEGILQLADAAVLLAINSAALDSAAAQTEQGADSLDEARETALTSADISGGLTLSTVSAILAAQSFSMPAGYVEQDGVSYMVSVGDELTDPDELAGLLIMDTGEDAIGPIYLSDVARIFVTDDADSTYAKLNGENSLILSFEKQSNAATADVTDALGAAFASLEAAYPGLSFVPLMNQGAYIYMIVNSILQSLLFGAVFAILVLLVFLRDLRPTFITLVSIPLSVVFAVVLMYFSGVTLNMISLSGLAVSVGMLVDNSIVVMENIYRLRAKGATAVQAAVHGAKQVAGAITASTLTTICVFLPIVFVSGITRQLFVDLALTMSYALLASLIAALTLVPAMSRGMLGSIRRSRREAEGRGESIVYRVYRRVLAWTLRFKWLVLPAAVALLVVSGVAAVSRGFSFMPSADTNAVSISITMPEDTDRDAAVATADEVMARILTLDNVESAGAMMGSGTVLGGGSDSYDVTVYVTLTEGSSGSEAGKRITALCEDLDCELDADSEMMSMSYLSGSGLEIRIFGSDMEALQQTARKTADVLRGISGLTDVDDGLEAAAPAVHIAIDRNAAMEKGYTVAQLYMQVATALTGSATAISIDMDAVTADVLVQTDAAMTRDDLAALELSYTNADGEPDTFRLGDVAVLEDTVSLSSISRSNQRRYLSVTAAVAEGGNITLAADEAADALGALSLPAGVSYEFSGESETTMEAVTQLMEMLALGVVLVYFIMVAQFQSLKSPFIVMFTIPLAFTGGFLALLVCGMDVSVISLIGFVMLTGVIVNNGIVLVDYVNQLRVGGMERRAALAEAGVTRMRPIFMTSLTTILGLIVMALGREAGTAMMQPIAVVCIGGLLYATLMTLLVVPCIYDMMNKKELSVVTDEAMEFDDETPA